MTGLGRLFAFIGVLAILAGLAVIAFIVSGSYAVGADNAHGFLDRIAGYTRGRSVAREADGIAVPPLTDPQQIAMGAHHYKEMCTGCHLAPGMAENEMRPGMDPKPPKLAERKHPDAREDFWIIKHGIKMTAMPAWGKSHSDDEIWAMTAFLQKLPGMSQAQYASLTAGDEHDHEHQEHEHQ
jgi:mono/diheme cytochrome c family protein